MCGSFGSVIGEASSVVGNGQTSEAREVSTSSGKHHMVARRVEVGA